MANYNTPRRYLEESIGSVTAQQDIDLRDIEIVVVDDCSNDESFNTLKEVASDVQKKVPDLDIKIDRNPSHSCPAVARNKAIGLSSGEYVGVLDSDDALTTNCLREFMDRISENRHADFIFSDIIKTGQSLDDVIYIRQKSEPFSLHQEYKPNPLIDPLFRMIFLHHFSVFRTKAVKEIGGYRNQRIGEDLDLFMRISQLSQEVNFAHIALPLYFYRSNPNSIISKEDNRTLISSDIENISRNLQRLGHSVSKIMCVGEIPAIRNVAYDFFTNGHCIRAPWLDYGTMEIIDPRPEAPETPELSVGIHKSQLTALGYVRA